MIPIVLSCISLMLSVIALVSARRARALANEALRATRREQAARDLISAAVRNSQALRDDLDDLYPRKENS